jgi:hypothetical protein
VAKGSCRDAVSKAASRALDTYYQAAPGGAEAELVGRVFEEYLNRFRRMVWASENIQAFLAAAEGVLASLPEWVVKDFKNLTG